MCYCLAYPNSKYVLKFFFLSLSITVSLLILLTKWHTLYVLYPTSIYYLFYKYYLTGGQGLYSSSCRARIYLITVRCCWMENICNFPLSFVNKLSYIRILYLCPTHHVRENCNKCHEYVNSVVLHKSLSQLIKMNYLF